MEDKEYKKICKHLDILICLMLIGIVVFIATVTKVIEMF